MPDLLGAHMSIAGGLYRALERGHEAGCSVVQIFLKNQLQWTARPYTQEEIRQFARTRIPERRNQYQKMVLSGYGMMMVASLSPPKFIFLFLGSNTPTTWK